MPDVDRLKQARFKLRSFLLEACLTFGTTIAIEHPQNGHIVISADTLWALANEPKEMEVDTADSATDHGRALIIAEIERLDRTAAQAPPQPRKDLL
jgi:hypothetical protein